MLHVCVKNIIFYLRYEHLTLFGFIITIISISKRIIVQIRSTSKNCHVSTREKILLLLLELFKDVCRTYKTNSRIVWVVDERKNSDISSIFVWIGFNKLSKSKLWKNATGRCLLDAIGIFLVCNSSCFWSTSSFAASLKTSLPPESTVAISDSAAAIPRQRSLKRNMQYQWGVGCPI